jgi:GNAT superfamily N-acetyltransferase
MSSGAPTDSKPASASVAGRCTVRHAGLDDLQAAVGAVGELLVELGGKPPPTEAMQAAARELIANPDAGLLLLAEQDGELVGVLAASWQLAIHTAGRYALLQDLWVKPSHRSSAIGREMLQALCAVSRERGLPRVEVGLPSDDFPRMEATRGFYLKNGFKPLGPRMRLPLT